jgi:hypothetical protein
VRSKALKDYMEVLGYAEAARWVYGQALDPGEWTTGELLTITELRNVHRTLMAKVWEVSPHPDATERETPGSFREHDIHPFGGGCSPSLAGGAGPSRRLGEGSSKAGCGHHQRRSRRLGRPGRAGGDPQRFRAHPSLPGRQLPRPGRRPSGRLGDPRPTRRDRYCPFYQLSLYITHKSF